MSVRDRHLAGVGAAACAVCCAAPVLSLLGLAGAGAAAALVTFALAGTAFSLVVGVAALSGLVLRRRRGAGAPTGATPAHHGAAPVELMPTRLADDR
jgi:hypothetical protein